MPVTDAVTLRSSDPAGAIPDPGPHAADAVCNRSTDQPNILSPFWAPGINAIATETIQSKSRRTVSWLFSFRAGEASAVERVRLVVRATQPTTITVAIHGQKPLEPNHQYALAVPSGTTSFILPV